MTGIIKGLVLPPWLPLVGYGMLAVAAASGGAWLDHKYMNGVVAKEQAKTHKVEADYSAYKAQAADAAAKSALDYALTTRQLQAALELVRADYEKEKLASDKKSAALKELLQNAKPTEINALGPAALLYIERLKEAGP
jgi:hypothetical protein